MEERSSVSPLELFFDLVFVFAPGGLSGPVVFAIGYCLVRAMHIATF